YDNFGILQHLGGPVQLSMYSSSVSAGADVFSLHNSGFQTSDTAGAVTPGSLTPGDHDLQAGGGVEAAFDGTSLIRYNGNQRLLFNVTFDYQNGNTNIGTSMLTPGVASAGAVRSDIYTLSGTADYTINSFYLAASAAFDWTHFGITDNLDTSTGNTNG